MGGLATCCLLVRLSAPSLKSYSGWLSPGSFPYPGGGLEFDIERLHPERAHNIFSQAQEHIILSLNFL